MARSFIVARAEVDHDIRLKAETGEPLSVRVGEPFRVTFAYRCHEVSRDEDRWRFRLRSSLAGQGERSAERTVRDRRGRDDTVWSNVATEHVCDRPGEHVLSFSAEVETTRRGWGDASDRESRERSFEGTVTVRAG